MAVRSAPPSLHCLTSFVNLLQSCKSPSSKHSNYAISEALPSPYMNNSKFCASSERTSQSRASLKNASLSAPSMAFRMRLPCLARNRKGWAEACAKFDEAVPCSGGEQGNNLVQALHDAARVFQSAMEEQTSLTRGPWFAQKWLGIDKNAWMKALAYQAAVHSVLQAVLEISARGEGRDRDAHVFVQRSLMRQSVPLEDSIRQQLSSRDPSADDWLWLQQHPLAVASFVRFLEKDLRFAAITSTGWDGPATKPSKASDIALLSLALSSSAAVMKLGSAAVSCPLFLSTLPEEIGRQMQKLTEVLPMDQVYSFASGIGLKGEFLGNFGSRVADNKKWREGREVAFWVDLVQQLLRGALIREGVRSRLEAYDSVEVLERDLAVFGFFSALGRSTRAYLAAKGVSDSEESLASLLRYLEGGSVLFYPQLATVSTYQLFVEVVCEEMEWLPFYPGIRRAAAHGENGRMKSGVSKAERRMIIAAALQTCSLWVNSFVHHSSWVQQQSGFRAAKFLSVSQQRLEECNKTYNIMKRSTKADGPRDRVGEVDSKLDRLLYRDFQERAVVEQTSSSWVDDGMLWNWDVPVTKSEELTSERIGLQEMERQLKLFDEELQSVEIALGKLELLVKDSEASSLVSGRERPSTARADLVRIRLLKREVEALEASLELKAVLKEERVLKQQVEEESRRLQQQRSASQNRDLVGEIQDPNQEPQSRGRLEQEGAANWGRRLMRFMFPFSDLRKGREDNDSIVTSSSADDGLYDEKNAELVREDAAGVSKEVETFELLRGELAALESRLRQCAGQTTSDRPLSEEEGVCASDYEIQSSSSFRLDDDTTDVELAGAYGDVFSKSIEKLKDASSDVWRGTQLLGTDVGAAIVLLRTSVAGQPLTNREQKILRRTLTDLASVIPIGFLMLLPVTAVGHAAILAAIQKYVPALIPSAYAPERLDVLRRLEQVRHLEPQTAGTEKLIRSPRKLEGSSQSKTDEN